MKKVSLVSLCLYAAALCLVVCSKNSATNPSSQNTVYDYSDTVAVRAILDANGLSSTSAGSPTITVIMLDQNNHHRVKELNLINKGISVLSSRIEALTAMDIMRLDTNSISALPAEIGKCTSLVLIQLPNNKLTTLPSEISSLHNLSTLILSHNSISSLPQGLWSLSKLSQLDLDFNQLTSIPATVSTLTSLQRLTLNNNQLSALPVSLMQSSVQYMLLDNNHICKSTLDPAFVAWLDNRAEQDWESTQGTCP